MAPIDVMCTSCGWRNTPDARRCGNCGEPLEPGWLNQDTPPTAYSSGEGQTEWAPASAWSAQPTAPARWPAQSARPTMSGTNTSSRRRGWWKGALAALAVVALIVAAAAAAGEIFARPALHQAVDSHVRSALHQAVSQIPTPNTSQLASGATLHYQITAAEVNARVRSELGSTSGISDAQVQFVHGQIVVTITAQGQQGTVTTDLAAVNGRLRAQNTQVSCPLCLVESNADMQASLNDALNSLPQQYYVTQFTVNADAIDLTVRTR